MRHLRPVPPDAPIYQANANSDKYAERICDPVTHVGATVEGGLYELNNGAKGARANKDGDQPEPAGARKGKGESREGNQVYEFVDPLQRWGRRFERPEQRDG